MAARISPARAWERLCGGQAITVVISGASSTGTAARTCLPMLKPIRPGRRVSRHGQPAPGGRAGNRGR